MKFTEEKETKNTWRFQEVPDDDGMVAVGPLYVQKHALKAVGWKPGMVLEVKLSV